MKKYSSIKPMADIAAHFKNKMTNLKMFEMLMKEEINNLRLLNEDGFKFTQLILNKGQLNHFKITINIEQGKTLFEKISKCEHNILNDGQCVRCKEQILLSNNGL